MRSRRLVAALVTLPCLAAAATLSHAAPQAAGPTSTPRHPFAEGAPYAALYEQHCARCHGADAAARQPPANLAVPPFNFRRCGVASGEPVAEWVQAIRDGGAAVGRSPDMPAFGDKLAAEDIESLARALRALCTDAGWPNGNLNFPRPVTVEKAFPEDEVVFGTSLAHGPGDERMLRLDATIEKRLGKRSMVEVTLPGGASWGTPDGGAEAGDLSLALKHVLFADRQGSQIVSAGLEVTLPTAPAASSLGHGTPLYEPFVAAGLQRGRTYVQTILSLEFPADRPWDDRELGYGVYVGRDLSASSTPWTIGAEFTGENRAVAITPQIRKAITRTGALAVGLGVHIPLNERGEEPVCTLFYLAWDFLEPVRARR